MFSIKADYFGIEPLVVVESRRKGVSAAISRRGANLIWFRRPEGDYIDGYQNDDELRSGPGARSCIMLPYSNRIAENKYTFNGVGYALPETGPFGINIHGFLHSALLTLTDAAMYEDYALLCFGGRWDKGQIAGYPWALEFTVQFTITEHGVALAVTMRNPNPEPLPVCTGWHPYFMIPGTRIDELLLEINAEYRIVTGKNYIPLNGDDAFEPVAGREGIDFGFKQPEQSRLLSGKAVNCCYSGLVCDPGGNHTAKLISVQQKRSLELYQCGGVVYAYTADESPVRPRHSIAIEPVEFITNAFNRKEAQAALTLAPMAERVFTCGFRVCTWD